jgi:hypothetical protein
MRLRLLFAAACALVLLLPSLGEARSSRTVEVRILSVVSGYSQTDVEPKGLSAGDRVRMTDRLYNLVAQFGKPKGAPVGTDSGTMTIRRGKQTANFQGVARLPGGTMVVKGRVTLGRTPTTLTVAGGTGRYSRARGTVTVRTLDANGRASNIFHLTLP